MNVHIKINTNITNVCTKYYGHSLWFSHATLDRTESMHFLTQAKAVSIVINANRRHNP